MLLWPSRIVIPLLDESVTGPLDDLYLRWVVELCGRTSFLRGKVANNGSGNMSTAADHVVGPGMLPVTTATATNLPSPGAAQVSAPQGSLHPSTLSPLPDPNTQPLIPSFHQAQGCPARRCHRGARPAQGRCDRLRRLLRHRLHHRACCELARGGGEDRSGREGCCMFVSCLAHVVSGAGDTSR